MIRALALLLLWVPLGVAQESERPTVVSLDYCADQFVLGLADPDQILGVSHGADKPHSHLREKAADFRKIRSTTEDVIALNPDLIINHWGADAHALAMYERFGIKVHQIGFGSTLDAARNETLSAAIALGQPERGRAFIDAMYDGAPSSDQAALYITPGGLTAGNETMVGDIMRLSLIHI